MRRTVGLAAGIGALAMVVAALPAIGAGWTPSPGALVIVDTAGSKTDAAVGASSHGEAVALWSEHVNSPDGTATALMASVRDGGDWGTATQLDTGLGSQAVLDAKVLVDPTGFATALWIRRYPEGPKKLWFATRPTGGPWSAAAEVSASHSGQERLSAAMTPSGAITAVWQASGGGITAADKAAGGTSWTVGTVSVGGNAPAVAAAPNGDTAIAWGGSGLLKVKVRSGAGAWADVSTETGSANRPETDAVDGANEPMIAFGEDNQLHAAWWEYENPDPEEPPVPVLEQVRTSSRSTGGVWTVHPEPVSASATITHVKGIAADASGNVTVVWTSIQFEPQFETRYLAATRVSGVWEAPFALSGSSPVGSGSDPRLVVDPDGMFTAVWGQDTARANRRTAAGDWLEAPEILSATGAGFVVAAPDSAGEPLAAWTRFSNVGGFHYFVETRTWDPDASPGDTGGPVTTMTSPDKPYYLSPTVLASWSAVDPEDNGVSASQTRWRFAPWNGGFPGQYENLTSFLGGTGIDQPVDAGYTFCFSTRSQDGLGNTGDYAADACTATPVDDRTPTRAGTWKKLSDSRLYRGTALRSIDKGATLTLTGAQGKRIALVVSKGPGFGKVSVKYAGQSYGPYSLGAKTSKRKVVIPVALLDDVATGKVIVKVVSADGKKVVVDGVLVGRV